MDPMAQKITWPSRKASQCWSWLCNSWVQGSTLIQCRCQHLKKRGIDVLLGNASSQLLMIRLVCADVLILCFLTCRHYTRKGSAHILLEVDGLMRIVAICTTAACAGADDTAWARWNRAWTAEENRHGDLLNKYLYLTGRVDMRSVETTVQHLIGSGFDPQMSNNPLLCFVYTSFQERATKISHMNTASQARLHGDLNLANICSVIGVCVLSIQSCIMLNITVQYVKFFTPLPQPHAHLTSPKENL